MDRIHLRWFLVLVLVLVIGVTAFGFSADPGHFGAGDTERSRTLNDVPDAVKSAILDEILQECFDLEITEDDEVDENGRPIFEVEFEFGDVEVELVITASGEVIEKEVEHEDDDDD